MKERSYKHTESNPGVYQLVRSFSLLHECYIFMILKDGKVCAFSGGDGESSTIASVDIHQIVDLFEVKNISFSNYDVDQHVDIRVLYEFNTREDIPEFKSKHPEYFI
ncbi:hypothetical protein WCWAEYFT_CDS0120 [Vibrio phage VB_VaC_TDDLMA]